MKIKPEQFLIGLGVVIAGIWVLYALQPKKAAPVSVGTPPIAGGSGVGQTGALGQAVGSLVNALTQGRSTSSNQSTTTPGATYPDTQPDYSL